MKTFLITCLTMAGLILFFGGCDKSLKTNESTDLTDFDKKTLACITDNPNFQAHLRISKELLGKVAASPLSETQLTRLLAVYYPQLSTQVALWLVIVNFAQERLGIP